MNRLPQFTAQSLQFDLSGQLNTAMGSIQVNWQGSLPANQTVLLTGESGSGKTTLMRALCGLPSQVTGKITWGIHSGKATINSTGRSINDQSA